MGILKRGLGCFTLILGIGVLSACVAGEASSEEIASGNASLTVARLEFGKSEAAKTEFANSVLPLVNQKCAICHVAGPGPMWMAGPDVYQTMTTWPNLLLLSAPASSLLNIKGVHNLGSGPALTQAEQNIVINWLNLEVAGNS